MSLSFNKTDAYNLDLVKGIHHWNTDTFKWLFLGAPATASNGVKADLTEIAAGGGYSSGGIPQTITTVTQTGGVATVAAPRPSITASGDIGPVYGLALYNDTAANDPVIYYCNFDWPITIPNGATFEIPIDTSNGLYYLS